MISVILPTLGRPKQIVKVLKALKGNSKLIVEAVVLIDEEDKASKENILDYCSNGNSQYVVVRVMKGHPTPVEKWNHGAKHSKGAWIMLAADDIEFPPGWDFNSLDSSNAGFLAFRDREESTKFFEPHYMATRTWLKDNNGGVLACPHYKHWCPDVEIAARAHKVDQYVTSPVVIKHNHVLFGTAINDETYERGAGKYNEDLALMREREAKGFPNDFEGYL